MSVQQENFKAIANVIREKMGTEELIKPSQFSDKISEVYDKGKEAEKRENWMNHATQQNGTYRFAGASWNDKTFTPYTDINVTGGVNMFSYSQIKDLKGILERYGTNLVLDNAKNVGNCFANSVITHIPELMLVNATNISSMFSSAKNLISIDKVTFPDNLAISSNVFSNCTSLTEIRLGGNISKNFDIHYSPLSKASVESIVDALSDTASGQTVTFNKTKMNELFGAYDSDGISDWEKLTDRKKNWTFSLLDV